MTFASYLDQRVLVSISSGPPHMTVVHAMSTSGNYVFLRACDTGDSALGWQRVADVAVLEVLQSSRDSVSALWSKLRENAFAKTT